MNLDRGLQFFHRDRRRDPSGVQPPFSKKEDTLMGKKHEVNIMVSKPMCMMS